ncbi:4-hydroxybenzoate 3-monooxygenase [Streptomyces alkaliterrae]|uniref:4-hydroxybenzoate 3-monooxygenase n=1 Tax=Streptomyces alkaliterrae TaxID=2213162 RepID=A0A5P0YWU5_9ACTN|nr:4-hydroxybenzoate 3-monooxygenase [Streptomyces alkaliterrae]MBB1262085.1 4-hydroxybenzoate 3-monooxygenase [Streptomyces alkaliterrae]MQS04755.1 4-hydroxybenzoate 3-monooxygenase [Streptomyces alkaliterrae]
MSAVRRLRTQVGIVGAGPAGLVLGVLLLRAGIDVRIVERLPREEVLARARAGLLEDRVVRFLHEHGLAGRLAKEAVRHGRCDFLCLGRRLRFDYAERAGGAQHWVYPQQELVRDLIEVLEAEGRTPYFGQPASAVVDATGRRPRVECADLVLECDVVVGADGWQGVSRRALPADVREGVGRRYPHDWLTVLAEVDRPVECVLYAIHERGFAAIVPRTENLARLYLQVPRDEDPAAWPEERIREQARLRLAAAGSSLPRITALRPADALRMRSSVVSAPRHGRLFLAGDAAHILTPCGAKGMNLAVADAADLADSLVRQFRDGDPVPLAGYPERRLHEAWRAQEFSDALLHLLHLPHADPADGRPAPADPAGRFEAQLRLERIRRLVEPGPAGTAFAHGYVGSSAWLPPLPGPHSM